jgi:hypothetical protein
MVHASVYKNVVIRYWQLSARSEKADASMGMMAVGPMLATRTAEPNLFDAARGEILTGQFVAVNDSANGTFRT